MVWVKLVLGLAGLGLTAYIALKPNPLQQALIELIRVLTELLRRSSF